MTAVSDKCRTGIINLPNIIIRHIIMRFFGIFVTFVNHRKNFEFFGLISVYLLQITIGLLFFATINLVQSKLFAQNNNFDDFNESSAIVLKRSIDSISRFIRVECNMRILTIVNGVEFSANGRYEEQAVIVSELEKEKDDIISDNSNLLPNQLSEFQRTMFRQELYFTMDTLSVQTEPNRIILVCYPNRKDSKNGNIWQFKSINGNKTLHQININMVETAIKKSQENKLKAREQRQVPNRGEQITKADSLMFPQVGMLWNVGGMTGVLSQIDRFYEFTELPKTETIDDIKVLKLVGSLRQVYFDFLLQNHGGLDENNRYPSNLPCDIEVYIGVNNLFPSKIRYLNRKTKNSKPVNLLVEINYGDIIINGDQIPEHRFSTFQNEVPAGVSKIDSCTEQYIKSLGLE
jgi:hypothetical protein